MYKNHIRNFHLQNSSIILSSEMAKILVSIHTPYIGTTLVFIHERVVRARQLASVAQLVRALHQNRRAAASIPARGPTHCVN